MKHEVTAENDFQRKDTGKINPINGIDQKEDSCFVNYS